MQEFFGEIQAIHSEISSQNSSQVSRICMSDKTQYASLHMGAFGHQTVALLKKRRAARLPESRCANLPMCQSRINEGELKEDGLNL